MSSTRLLACKAAALSSAMLTRRKSSSQAPNGAPPNDTSSGSKVARRARESIVALTEMINLDPAAIKKKKASELLEWHVWSKTLRVACLASMVSVCLHTPNTLEAWWALHFLILGTDIIVTAIFTIDALAILRHSGSWQAGTALIGDRWARFDLFLLILHYLSVAMHLTELFALFFPHVGFEYHAWFGIIRAPRPFVMVRFIRSMLKLRLPKNRIKQILKRSSQQIQNVTIFFTFFMALYAIMGIQLFGRMDYHCILKDADERNVTVNDLAIPDTMCSRKGGGGYECPPNMRCAKIDNLSAQEEGFYGMFNNFLFSLFTVYMAASQEGWVYVMYDCLDTFPSWVVFSYFVTLIFFLAWLVKNVFIAVITETFAEIRVQFNEMWQPKQATEENYAKKLEKSAEGWRLVEVDDYARQGNAPVILHQLVSSTAFIATMMGLVLGNAIFHSTFVYRHDGTDEHRRQIYYFVEIGFTILFNIECLLKIVGHGWSSCMRRGQHKFELLLCIGSTLNVIPWFYDHNIFTYFQVLRIVRLIKASPMLEDFIYKIFGPGKKLGGLVIFTMTLLIVTSAISLQLFCFVPNLNRFTTFPQAFISMFQIITQEGWTDVVVEILRTMNVHAVPAVAVYFLGYHLLVTLIVLSLFVAVILDNLEMDEALKKIKQLKAREQNTIRTTLPWRLRVFDRFPTRPQMVSLRKISSEFPVPKIRQSFTRTFAEVEDNASGEDPVNREEGKHLLRRGAAARSSAREGERMRLRHIGQLSSKNIINNLIEESNRNRAVLSDSTQFIAQFARSGTFKGAARTRNRGLVSSLKGNKSHFLDSLKENGDINNGDTAPKERKEGDIDIKALQQKRAHAEITRNRIEEEMRENHPMFDRPLFAVGRDSRLRQACRAIVYAKYTPALTDPTTGKQVNSGNKQLREFISIMTYLDWTMVVITSLSCCSMLFESPWPTTPPTNLFFNNPYLQVTEYMFVFAMTFELAVKIVANGLFFTPHAVVRDVGGIMTIFIYITSVVHLVWMPRHVEINSLAQLVMIFRAMRPLRIYTLVPHIRRVVLELCRGFKEIILVTILLVVLMFVFASFGVQIAGGKLASCNDRSITAKENCTGIFEQQIFVTRMEVKDKHDPVLHPKIFVPRVWTNPRNFNFDHIGFAMLALFETLSYKGWNVVRDILYMKRGPWAVLFIHIYVFIGCMIGLTLFVGVVIANYTENRGTALLTVDQRRWHDLKARLKMAQPLHTPPRPDESSKIRSRVYDMVLSRVFKQFFFWLVMLNTACLVFPWSVEEEKNSPTLLLILTVTSASCCVLFAVENLLKVVAFTPNGFWQSRRNRIDAILTLAGLAWIFIHFVLQVPMMFVGGSHEEWKKITYTGGYIVAVCRFFSIAGRKSTLKMLMLTVLMSMVRSLFIIAAMFLLVLFYAYTGVILFSMVKYGQAVSKHVNFRNGREALTVLFRSVTGEDWNDIMHDCMRSPPFCSWTEGNNYWETDCGNYFGAIIYFCSFYLIIVYIVLNLLVAIIMENFSLFYSSEEDALLSYNDIRNFQQVWNDVDRDQKRQIPVGRVKFLLRLLRGRLEVDPQKDRLLFKHMCHEMARLHNNEDVSFHDVLNMLSYRSVDIRKSLQLEELLHREELEYLIEEEVAKHTIRTWLESCLKRIKSKQKGETSLLGASLHVHRQSGASSVPRAPSSTQLTTSPDPITQLSIASLRQQSMESSEDELELAHGRRRSRATRRNSIPELLMGKRRSEDKGNLSLHAPRNLGPTSAATTAPPSAMSTLSTRDRRGTMRHFNMRTCELPELEESGEDASPLHDRRHSYDLQMIRANETAAGLEGSTMMSSVGGGAASCSTARTPSPQLLLRIEDHSAEVYSWWSTYSSTATVHN